MTTTTTDALKTLISGLSGKTVYGQLEPLMPEIDRKIKEGVPRTEIYRLITAQGITITEGTFYNYIHRYRKRNSESSKPVRPKSTGKQDGNSVPVEPKASASTPPQNIEPDLDEPSLDALLKGGVDRDKYADQFMTRKPLKLGGSKE